MATIGEGYLIALGGKLRAEQYLDREVTRELAQQQWEQALEVVKGPIEEATTAWDGLKSVLINHTEKAEIYHSGRHTKNWGLRLQATSQIPVLDGEPVDVDITLDAVATEGTLDEQDDAYWRAARSLFNRRRKTAAAEEQIKYGIIRNMGLCRVVLVDTEPELADDIEETECHVLQTPRLPEELRDFDKFDEKFQGGLTAQADIANTIRAEYTKGDHSWAAEIDKATRVTNGLNQLFSKATWRTPDL